MSKKIDESIKFCFVSKEDMKDKHIRDAIKKMRLSGCIVQVIRQQTKKNPTE